MIHERAIELLIQARVRDAAVVPAVEGGGFCVFSGMELLGRGATIEAAMQNARANGAFEELPAHPQFRSEGKEVQRRGVAVAMAESVTLARRIAHALNRYIPDERGR
jgi:hypothetical protein